AGGTCRSGQILAMLVRAGETAKVPAFVQTDAGNEESHAGLLRLSARANEQRGHRKKQGHAHHTFHVVPPIQRSASWKLSAARPQCRPLQIRKEPEWLASIFNALKPAPNVASGSAILCNTSADCIFLDVGTGSSRGLHADELPALGSEPWTWPTGGARPEGPTWGRPCSWPLPRGQGHSQMSGNSSGGGYRSGSRSPA